MSAPEGFQAAYEEIAQGGWLGLSGNPEFGGRGMPKMLGCLVEEMFWGANSAPYLYGSLTVGACICLDTHGSDEQRTTYLPRFYSGEWSGTIGLTEVHVGSDLGIIRTRAVFVGMQLDRAKYLDDTRARALSELLTAVAEAFLTDHGFDCAVMGQRVFGGHGYIKQWGAEQIVRDGCIARICEGTNGIQALDLIGRKVLRDERRTLRGFLDFMREEAVPEHFQAQLHSALDAFGASHGIGR
ncbi:MAG: acyl-CoA dehydrogenase family protein [Pseudomonadales bacterium]|jgi:alkylation response protein AidB-like acyl-CoA dehydrogenase|nr:acyl-CoA dehydrogenase family protein [Pseudomonadales bacterium]MDP6470731.1 acyl-CoA dehydrogenase family protein [Pseudomonadales bacterium]MDP6828317.1 acyl-CoA dehydrogenase family protein [Pseudomonadales bacterium]MDP6972133.1 acyl-CoA dehydrogenase family protein [Pseudomonadales bacterium]